MKSPIEPFPFCPTCGLSQDDFTPVVTDTGILIGWDCPICNPPLEELNVNEIVEEVEKVFRRTK